MTVHAATPAQPTGCTNFKLRQLTRVVTQRYDADVAPSGLKTTQYSLLTHAEKLGPVRPVDLAAQLQMTASTLSRNLQLLVDAGWLSVDPGHDARSRLVRITPAGIVKRREAQKLWRQAQLRLNQLLGDERVVRLHQLIEESLALLAEAGQGGESGDQAPDD